MVLLRCWFVFMSLCVGAYVCVWGGRGGWLGGGAREVRDG